MAGLCPGLAIALGLLNLADKELVPGLIVYGPQRVACWCAGWADENLFQATDFSPMLRL